jgi:hypothetical protein
MLTIQKEIKKVSYEKIEVPDGQYYGHVDDTNDNDLHRYYSLLVKNEEIDLIAVFQNINGSEGTISKSHEYDLGWHTERIFTGHPKAKQISAEEFLSKYNEVLSYITSA